MKDNNGIEIECPNCVHFKNNSCDLENDDSCEIVFIPHHKALEARIAELQKQNELLKKAVFVNKDMDNLGKDFDIGKLVKPLVWEYREDLGIWKDKNGLGFFIKHHVEHTYILETPENIGIVCKSVERAQDVAFERVVNFVRSACGIESEDK